ncbi:MAG: hypothetical protein EG822_14150 [Deltaproteobacteria bacterium]|nr:hypothetical protein [Deltaproteobacteria bacterium]TLN03591.1 MAG: hypothetical protein FDZ73_06825 [bacterium]
MSGNKTLPEIVKSDVFSLSALLSYESTLQLIYERTKKIDSWIDSNIHVDGRPEWVFVKVYTHGTQSRKIIFSSVVDEMFSYLEKKYGQGDYRLHYVTAREAYNIVRAAEGGEIGDPSEYYNYSIKSPLNKSNIIDN